MPTTETGLGAARLWTRAERWHGHPTTGQFWVMNFPNSDESHGGSSKNPINVETSRLPYTFSEGP